MRKRTEVFQNAFHGALIADALAMPVHWYYDRAALRSDYGEVKDFLVPKNPHSGSILWRSQYEPLNEKGDILHDQAQYWGQREVHYHQFLQAGENTVNLKLAKRLYELVLENGGYDRELWLECYVKAMRTPGWHGDTYLEEYHRGFFTRYAQGKPLLKCGIKDEHIGGLSQVPALIAAYSQVKGADLDREELRAVVRDHVTNTHRHSNVLRAADCLTRLLWSMSEGIPLREAIMHDAGDWFSTKKAMSWSKHPDEVVVGEKLSTACYIDQAFPASIYLAWNHFTDFTAGVSANAQVGGDSCHRGVVVGSLLGASVGTGQLWERYQQLNAARG